MDGVAGDGAFGAVGEVIGFAGFVENWFDKVLAGVGGDGGLDDDKIFIFQNGGNVFSGFNQIGRIHLFVLEGRGDGDEENIGGSDGGLGGEVAGVDGFFD